MDEALVEKDKAGTLMSEGRMVTHLMTEADGTYVRGMQKKAHIEIKHLITYEGGKKRKTPPACEPLRGDDNEKCK
ncbi:hypothetical protein QS257_15675 [Terrilactibacillus sp. S3-3]|nr:hypothetical protein QS257_15675 [Terrilactibacillus sp. S3-3]